MWNFEKFCEHPEVLQHLMPLQQSSSARGSGHYDDPSSSHSDVKHGGGKGDKGKGKAKGKTKGPGIPVPDDCEIFR